MMLKLLPILALLASAKALTDVQEQVEEVVEQAADLAWGAPTGGWKDSHRVGDWVIPKGERDDDHKGGHKGGDWKDGHKGGDWKDSKSCDHHGCGVCHSQSKDFVVVNCRVPRCEAEGMCAKLGMELANVDSENFEEVSNLAYKCSGANSQSWINSWNTDEYKGSCIVFSTGSTCGGGAINTPKCCTERLPVICQKKSCYHRRHHEHKHKEHDGRRGKEHDGKDKEHRRHDDESSSSDSTYEESSDDKKCREHHRRGYKPSHEGRDRHEGRDGREGYDGRDGREGYDGRDGREGYDGRDGREGRDGRDGDDGHEPDNEYYKPDHGRDGHKRECCKRECHKHECHKRECHKRECCHHRRHRDHHKKDECKVHDGLFLYRHPNNHLSPKEHHRGRCHRRPCHRRPCRKCCCRRRHHHDKCCEHHRKNCRWVYNWQQGRWVEECNLWLGNNNNNNHNHRNDSDSDNDSM